MRKSLEKKQIIKLPKRVKGIKPSQVEDVVNFAESLVLYAIQGKENDGIQEKYKRAIQYRNGNHKHKKEKKQPVWNKFSAIVENRISHISDAALKWKFRPTEEMDLWVADALNTILSDVMMDYAKWEEKKEESILDCAYAGSTHVKTVPDTETGFTNFIPVLCPEAFPDPTPGKKGKIRYFVHLIPKSVKDIEKDYGVTGIQAEPELEHLIKSKSLDEVDITYQATSATSHSMENIYAHIEPIPGKVKILGDVIGRTIIAEIWLEDRSTERIPFKEDEVIEEHNLFAQGIYEQVKKEENHIEHLKRHQIKFEELNVEENPREKELLRDHIEAHFMYPQTETRDKYPKGRLITICQGKLLRNEPNPVPVNWRDVFVKWDWQINPGSYWGKNMVDDLFDPQDALNHRKNSITKNINNINNPVVYVKTHIWDKLFGGKQKLTNITGLGIPIRQTGDVDRDFGPAMPPHVSQDLLHTEDFMDMVSLKSDLTAGIYPRGSPPAYTVDQLLGEAKTPLRNVLKHYSFALAQMGRNAIAVMNEFMEPDTKIRILGEGAQDQVRNWGELKDQGLFDIRVSVEATLASTRQQRLKEAIELRREGVFDNIAVLEYVDHPSKYEVMERVNEIAKLRMINKTIMGELDESKKEMATIRNRMQSKEGEGNVREKT